MNERMDEDQLKEKIADLIALGNYWPGSILRELKRCRDSEEEKDNLRKQAIEFAFEWTVDGDHHKMWVIDQMLRILAGDSYDSLVTQSCVGEDGPDTYGWDTGIAP